MGFTVHDTVIFRCIVPDFCVAILHVEIIGVVTAENFILIDCFCLILRASLRAI